MKYFKSLNPENKFIFANKDGISLHKKTWLSKEYSEYKNCITFYFDKNDVTIKRKPNDTILALEIEEIEITEFIEIFNNIISEDVIGDHMALYFAHK